MFSNNNNIYSVYLPKAKFDNTEDISEMFMDCYNLKYIDLSSATFDNIVKYDNVFKNCYKLNSIKINQDGVERLFDLNILDKNYWGYVYVTQIAYKNL